MSPDRKIILEKKKTVIFHQIASLSCLPGRQEAVGFFFSSSFCWLSQPQVNQDTRGGSRFPLRSDQEPNGGELLPLPLPHLSPRPADSSVKDTGGPGADF